MTDKLQKLLGFWHTQKVKDGFHLETEPAGAGTIQIAPHPFDEGKARIVYYARYVPEGSPPGDFKEVVVKEVGAVSSQWSQISSHYILAAAAVL